MQVRKPAVGELKPAAVTADIMINLKALRGDVRQEWDQLKQVLQIPLKFGHCIACQ